MHIDGDVEHVEGLVLHQFADDHAVGIELPRQLDELAGRDLALALGIRVPGEQRRRVWMAGVVLETQLEQVLLDGDDPLERRHLPEEFGEQRRLARAGWPRHEDGEATPHQGAELRHQVMREQTEIGQPVEADLADHEPADGEARVRRHAVFARSAEHHHHA